MSGIGEEYALLRELEQACHEWIAKIDGDGNPKRTAIHPDSPAARVKEILQRLRGVTECPLKRSQDASDGGGVS